MRMVGDEYDHTSSIIGRKTFGHVIYCVPMVDDLLMGLHVEKFFFINYCTGEDESLHICIAKELRSQCWLMIGE